jgi:hypothetical protein
VQRLIQVQRESSEFELAVAFWNAESERHDSTQNPLPTLH